MSMRRRSFIGLGTAGMIFLAGCPSQSGRDSEPSPTDESSETPGQQGGDMHDSAENESSSPTESDSIKPTLDEFDTRPNDKRGSVRYQLAASDQRGIEEVRFSTSEEEVVKTFDEAPEIEVSGSIGAPSGQENEIQITIINTGDNQRTEIQTTYTRRYTLVTEIPWTVSCKYRPGGGNWNCKAGTPQIGAYEQASRNANRHLDQMTGHGVRRVQLRFRPDQLQTPEKRIIDSGLSEGFRIQYQFDIVQSIDNGTLQNDLRKLKQRIESIDPVHRDLENSSPVISILSVYSFGGDDTESKRLEKAVNDRYGGFSELMELVRSTLRIDDSDPYLIAETGMGLSRPRNGTDEFLSWVKSFDAITHPLWLGDMGPNYLKAVRKVESLSRNKWRWATENNLDFIPVVFPGYDNRENECWETESAYVKRTVNGFRRSLAVASEYATTDRLTVASFNDWFDGTQVEPGTADGSQYGTSYLEQIKELQQDRGRTPERSEYTVSTDGNDAAAGGPNSPLRTIGHALFRAGPGDTVNVRSGRYHEVVETVKGGTSEEPITITGPADAVFIGGNMTDLPEPMKIRHSHIHITGLTFDGLQDPDHPDDVSSYAGSGIQVNPWGSRARFPGYIEDIKVKPHAIGNYRGDMINTQFVNDVEIGEFKVIGPAGLKYSLGDAEGHNGEVVYIGTPATKFGGSGTSLTGANIDESHGYHVHHIDNSEAHKHAELVDVKGGAYDVTIEYCTDLGGGASYLLSGHDKTSETAISLRGNESTLRWSIIENSQGQAIEVGAWGPAHPERFEEINSFPFPEPLFDSGQDNSIYGNKLLDNGGLAVQYPTVDGEITEDYGPDDQKFICGNEYNGDTHGNPGKSCPDSVPSTDTIGHLGGDSPWA